jgi:predicted nucleic acid-binding protein
MNRALVDSSFLVAAYDTSDSHHTEATTFLESIRLHLIVPDVVFPEVTFVLRRAGGIPVVLAFLDAFVAAGLPTQALGQLDIVRARAVMAQYADSKLDFVDCCIVALAERLNITMILTFDRRDFRMIRPAHAVYFDLLPHLTA